MYFMYVDESGDPGLQNSPTTFYVLTGIVLHEMRWREYLDLLIDFRLGLRRNYDLKLREEIHASSLVNRSGGSLSRISKHNRLAILRLYANQLASMTDLNIINILVDKTGKTHDYDVFTQAWRALIQRFENTMRRRNFTGPSNPDDNGIIISDHTSNKKLEKLTRHLRRYNPIPHQRGFIPGYRDLPLINICEDPSFRDSTHSYFIQSCDVAAYLLRQFLAPNSYIRRKSGRNYFCRLTPILCTVASGTDTYGIVRL